MSRAAGWIRLHPGTVLPAQIAPRSFLWPSKAPRGQRRQEGDERQPVQVHRMWMWKARTWSSCSSWGLKLSPISASEIGEAELGPCSLGTKSVPASAAVPQSQAIP